MTMSGLMTLLVLKILCFIFAHTTCTDYDVFFAAYFFQSKKNLTTNQKKQTKKLIKNFKNCLDSLFLTQHQH
jgi:hypothetical protein